MLYVIISSEYCLGRDPTEIASQAIKGGADIIQMREKNLPGEELLNLGKRLGALCRANKTTFIVNDDPFIAKEVDAGGVHLGQEDLVRFPVEQARKVLGRDKMIGLSTHSFEQFVTAQKQDVDYLAFGPVFKTKTKDYFIGTEQIRPVLEAAKKPVFFIGGIDLSNLDVLLDMGVKNIALIRGILEAGDITAQTRLFKEKLTAAL